MMTTTLSVENVENIIEIKNSVMVTSVSCAITIVLIVIMKGKTKGISLMKMVVLVIFLCITILPTPVGGDTN